MDIKNIIIDAGKILKNKYYKNSSKYSIKEKYHLLSQADIDIHTYLSNKIKKIFQVLYKSKIHRLDYDNPIKLPLKEETKVKILGIMQSEFWD